MQPQQPVSQTSMIKPSLLTHAVSHLQSVLRALAGIACTVEQYCTTAALPPPHASAYSRASFFLSQTHNSTQRFYMFLYSHHSHLLTSTYWESQRHNACCQELMVFDRDNISSALPASRNTTTTTCGIPWITWRLPGAWDQPTPSSRRALPSTHSSMRGTGSLPAGRAAGTTRQMAGSTYRTPS